HRPAAIGREAVAGEVDHVDVGGAQRDAFLEDVRALVGERVHAALDDFLIADLPRRVAHLFAIGREHLVHLGVRNRFAISRLIAVPAAAGLLTEPAFLGDAVGELAVDEIGPLLGAALADL